MNAAEWVDRFATHLGKLVGVGPQQLLDLGHELFVAKGHLVPEYAAFVEHDEEHLHDQMDDCKFSNRRRLGKATSTSS